MNLGNSKEWQSYQSVIDPGVLISWVAAVQDGAKSVSEVVSINVAKMAFFNRALLPKYEFAFRQDTE